MSTTCRLAGASGTPPNARRAHPHGHRTGPIAADRGQILQLLDNLIVNALRYGEPGTPVKVTARHEGGMVQLAISDQGEGIVAGLEMVRGQLAGLLTGHGVEEIPAHGRAFDPTVHEAIAQVPTPGQAEGTVVEVVEKGYRHSDHVLRPTRVVIAARPAD